MAIPENQAMTADDLADAVRKARALLSDEKNVHWAEHESGDLNEGFIVYQARAMVALAERCKVLAESRDALISAWEDGWDCSDDPGHTRMTDAIVKAKASRASLWLADLPSDGNPDDSGNLSGSSESADDETATPVTEGPDGADKG